MIASFTHDCGCRFTRAGETHQFEQSFYCTSHKGELSSRASTEARRTDMLQLQDAVTHLCEKTHTFTLSTRQLEAMKLAIIQQTVAIGAERLRATQAHIVETMRDEVQTLEGITKLLNSRRADR